MAIEATLPPLIAAQLNYLLTHFPLPVKVDQVWSGCRNPQFSDRFSLLIPFCLDYIKWDVIYNAQYPLTAPDIIFAEEDEMFHPFVIEGEAEAEISKSSLCDWNCKDPTRLFSLINELRYLYMSYQKKRIGELEDERLTFELSTIQPREVLKHSEKFESVNQSGYGARWVLKAKLKKFAFEVG
ncbi:hypothetical protein GIB67_033869 [Kingdonia uniflora]|uniref:BRISC and BRCA1-A complex member 2 n=1 Tax=Kingdonia uniflora TaxID=39325 RepID=A0A7J7MJ64_9MAGN|nr:hypothetical protein GIB67_033869 [Kingdonia uniflora]